MNEELLSLRESLRQKRPMDWDALPDIPLYMDQVLSYMDRQVIRSEEGDTLTSAMVNNYTKSGLVPRAEGKKYSREHLCYLTAICVLKQVLSAKDMALVVERKVDEGEPVEALYRLFCESLDQALLGSADEMEAYLEEDRLADGAIHFALLAYAAGLVSRRYVASLRREKEAREPREIKKEKKGKHAAGGEE